MNREFFVAGPKMPPNRVELKEALEEFPASTLLVLINELPVPAYEALYHQFNMGGFVFRDFSYCEAEGGSDTIADLLISLKSEVDPEKQKSLAKEIAVKVCQN